ncbi:MAG: long-chain-acyl-CoA synthetase [Deltaproteobacteria bacterium]
MENAVLQHDPVQTIGLLKETQFMSLGSELERQAVQRADATALIFEDRFITFRELNEEANRYSNLFAGMGFKKGDVVALLMENRPEFLIAASGLSKLGIIVSLINNGVRGEVLAHALNICNARSLIVGGELLPAFMEIKDQVKLTAPARIFIEDEGRGVELPPGLEDIRSLLGTQNTDNPLSTGQVTSDDIIVYIYTSGTTGFPKACAVTQKRWLVLGNIFTLFGGLNPQSIQYMVLPLYHNSGFDIGYSILLVSGSTMVLRRKFSARAFWEEVRKYQANLFIYVGELCRYIFNQPERPDDADNPLEMITGNGMRGELMEPFRKRFGIKVLKEVYGATEGVGSFLNIEEIPGMCGNLVLGGMRQGEVIKYDLDEDVIVRNEKGFAVKCEQGDIGLLVCEINQLNVFAGYVNNPEATEAKIMRDVLAPGDKYFNSGDLVQLHDREYISFVDRLGDTFRWKSENVSTNQVSNVIDKFGQMEDSNVYGVKVPGMEGRCGMVAIKLQDGAVVDWERFSDYVNEKLPSFARPYFVRIRPEIDATNSFKQVKKGLQQEGYDPNIINDPLYFLHPDLCRYIPLTPEVYQDIVEQKVRF